MQRTQRILTLITCAVLSVGSVALAQVTSARLNGTVADETGATIAHARITVTNTATNQSRQITADDSGNYQLPSLPPGPYTITTTAEGFEQEVQTGIVLTVGQNATLPIKLKVGAATETATVTAGADLINTTTAELSQVVGEDEIKELPLNGRDPSSLVFLSAGVSNVLISQASSNQTSQSFSTQTGASAGGGRQGSTWYLLDGVPNMDTVTLLAAPFPNADATQEFRVITNNFDARYGFSPNAVVNIQTKGGSNALHGGVFEFIRNNDLNAANPFSGQNGGTKQVDQLKRNQFGGYAGGPILKDKLFIFGNYQGTRNNYNSSTNTANTPTTAMLSGDFSAVNGPYTDAYGNPGSLAAPFQTVNGKKNQVDPTLLSPGALALSKSLPLGQVASTGLVTYSNPAVRAKYDEGTGRLDYTINDKQRIFLRNFIYELDQPGASTPGNILTGVTGTEGKYLNEAIGHTWTISPTLLNSITVAYSSYDYNIGTVVKNASGNQLCLSQFIAVNDPPGNCYINLSAQEGSNYYGGSTGFSVFSGQPYHTKRRDWILGDTVTRTFGKSTLAVGTDLLHRHYYEFYAGPVNPGIGFNGSYTGFVLADFLLGYSTGVSQGSGEVGSTNGWMVGVYAQEQYKLTPAITVNAGLRWDPNLTPSIVGDRGAAFIPGRQSTRFPNAPLGLVFAGEQGIPSGLVNNSYGYFEPRIGIAWQPRPALAVRAGFGLFTQPLEDAFYNRTWDAPPFSPGYGVTVTAGQYDPFDNPWSIYAPTGGKSPFPPFVSPTTAPATNSTFPAQVGLSAVFAPNFKLGVTQSWNFSVEQQFGPSVALHMAYVGSETYHVATTVEQNPGHYFGDPTTPAGANDGARTTYPNFNSVLQVQDGATTSYHSAQVGIEKRYSHGFQVQSNFTWSKALDVGGSGDPTFESSVSDPYNIHEDHGYSSLNYPYIWVTNLLYRAPTFKGHNLLEKEILGGWELSGLYTAQSGAPFTVNGGNGNNNSYFDVGQDRADTVPGQNYGVRQGGKSHWLNNYFNPNAFKQNAFGTPGDMMKYSIQEAPIQTVDVAFIKNWSYRERYNTQFRWEMFNALNHPSYGQPDSNPGDSNFGQITGIGPIAPRVMQGALKITF
jgi:hypothetical protein